MPGQESVLNPRGRMLIKNIIETEQILSSILWGANRAEPIAVYDRILRPKEYVRSHLIDRFVNFTKSMFEPMSAPTEVLTKVSERSERAL
tara:strand:+ start:97 stop:366 length:270 start_codon:yes stop_codon:yes gene_type:complete